ncbi:Sodium-coupled monocarboxylate transporter 2 [Holothuria leucospilota]|uniref:Sodium-coupled monocarboxylate transporter 2 n=1 Tax=Holothuria leucospilota TaxID=206669 RepID=A0A9Q1C8L0_HOLLE|nr:Sodium-coupled monocarboxylate transporter 2 [Holothuria leucospilota]
MVLQFYTFSFSERLSSLMASSEDSTQYITGMLHLTAWDYLIVIAMLAVSAGIGVYFAIRSRHGQSSNDYFLGNRRMSVLPVAVSLAATVMSAITYLGTPADVYKHGPKYGLMFVTRFITPFIVCFCFVPIFYRLEITTVYEYLEMRFGNTLRFLVIASDFFSGFTYMGIVVYTPALALSTVTGINLTFSILGIGVICTFYTSIGGIKAVIWTDVFQAGSMVLGACIMIIGGTVKLGGVAEGWHRAVEGERGDLIDFNIDPTIRYTFWSIMLGGSSFWLMITGTKQSLVQRYNSCATEREAKIAALLGTFGMGIIEILAVTTGMTVYAFYSTCDPLTSSQIDRSDQIVPYFMMDVFSSYPGMPGILIGGAFCASLSSMSSVLNSLAAMTGQDIVKTIWPNMSEKKFNLVIKVISAIFGIITIALAFLASVLGDVLQTVVSIGGLTGGPILGIFLLAMLAPRCNSKGAVVGIIGGTMVGFTLYIGSLFYPPTGHSLPLSTEGCLVPVNATTSAVDTTWTDTFTETDFMSYDFNASTTPSPDMDPHRPPGIAVFNLSYLYMTTVPALVTIVLGLLVSLVTSWREPSMVDPKLLAPILAPYYAKSGIDNKNGDSVHKSTDYVPLKKV